MLWGIRERWRRHPPTSAFGSGARGGDGGDGDATSADGNHAFSASPARLGAVFTIAVDDTEPPAVADMDPISCSNKGPCRTHAAASMNEESALVMHFADASASNPEATGDGSLRTLACFQQSA
jgi:hypothetical protein